MFTTAFLAVSLSTSPVADTSNGAAIAAAAATTKSGAPGFARNGKPISYCVVDTVTGSRIPVKTCRTRAEWRNLGFDPLDAK